MVVRLKFTAVPLAYSIPLATSSSNYGVEGRVSPPMKTLTLQSKIVMTWSIRYCLKSMTAFSRSFSWTNFSRMGSYAISSMFPKKLVILTPLSYILL